jgi:ferrochelatase
MRNWRPFIKDALAEAARAGAGQLVVVPMAPQFSSLSVGKYREAVERARPAGVAVRFVEAWYDQPLLLDAFADKVRAALAGGPQDVVLFTAHSLPLRVVEAGDPYADQVRATARGIAQRVGLGSFELAWQSAGRTPEPWLGPALEEQLAALAAAGRRRVLVVPVSFVCDHTEVLFDVDVQAQAFAREHGIELQRSESLNTSPAFIRALAEVVRGVRG